MTMVIGKMVGGSGAVAGKIEYQTQAGALAVPTGTASEGRAVLVYNSTLDASFLFLYRNSVWRHVEIVGEVI